MNDRVRILLLRELDGTLRAAFRAGDRWQKNLVDLTLGGGTGGSVQGPAPEPPPAAQPAAEAISPDYPFAPHYVDVLGSRMHYIEQGTGDPILLLLVNDKSESATLSAGSDVPRAEDKVTITNGTPGLKKIEIIVNGKTFKVVGLKDGEETTVDISPAMVDGDANQVDFEVKGKPGSYANVMIWDGIGQ